MSIISKLTGLPETKQEPTVEPLAPASADEFNKDQPASPPAKPSLISEPSLSEEPPQGNPPPSIMDRPYAGTETFGGPYYTVRKEEPQHRMILMLAAQGYTNNEIAEITGFTHITVANVKKQPWAVEFLIAAQKENYALMTKSELAGVSVEAARVLADVARGKIQTTVAIRTKVCNSIVDRILGTATQVVHNTTQDPSQMTDAELAVIAAGRQNN